MHDRLNDTSRYDPSQMSDGTTGRLRKTH